jgi:hypothetical protein
MIHRRDDAYGKWRKTKTAQNHDRFIELRNKVKYAIKNAWEQYIWKLGVRLTGNRDLWKYIHSCKSTGLHLSFKDDNVSIKDPQDVANAFSETFQKNFNSTSNTNHYLRRLPIRDSNLNNAIITVPEVENLLRSVRRNAATGPDGIPGIILHECSQSLAASLKQLFEISLKLGKVPA